MFRQEEKMEKKNKAAINAVNQTNDQKNAIINLNTARNRQGQREGNYVKYFESSESELEEDSQGNQVKKEQPKKKPSGKDSEMVSQSDESDEEDKTAKSVPSARQQRAH